MTFTRVLIVEDDPDIRQVIRMALRFHGVTEIVAAGSGEECISIAAEVKPDVILMDVMMPRMDGYQVCRHLKAGPSTSHIPVIFLTAKAQQSERQLGFQVGAVGYLIKPFDPMTLCDEILSILNGGAE
jgi:CheY-like chemotaxis protein